MVSTAGITAISDEVFGLIGTGRQVQPFSSGFADSDLATAYQVAKQVCDRRVARGDSIVGRKIGFTNREVQRAYGNSGPTCRFMFDTTLSELLELTARFQSDTFRSR